MTSRTSTFQGTPTRLATRLAMVCVLFSPVAAGADVVLNWNATAVSTMLGQSPAPNPFAQARFMAITQLAVFEAVNAVTGEYQPYLGTIDAATGASADAAAIAAAHAVLLNYFPGSAAALNAERSSSLAAIPDGPAKDDGVAAVRRRRRR
ncbi:MAG TPA: hypothetical protein VEO00_03535 [Actinomycetota bacterium]|nr:hypothetical protein [Actinomycetota bacterium]